MGGVLRLIEKLKAGASPPDGICMKRIGVRNRCGINKHASGVRIMSEALVGSGESISSVRKNPYVTDPPRRLLLSAIRVLLITTG